MKFLTGLFSFIVILLALAFALANRHPAVISLWPLGVEIEAPLFLLTLGTFLLGMLAGAAIIWFSMIPHRLRARQLCKELEILHNKVGELQQTVIPLQGHDERRRGGDSLLAGPQPKRRFWGSRS